MRGGEAVPAPTRLWLIEPAASPFCARIAQAARELQLSVERIDAPTRRPPDGVIGIGPSIHDPVQVARDLRRLGASVPCIFFAATAADRDALNAELIRNPFVCDRYELIEVTDDRRQLARSIRQAGARVERTRRPSVPSRRVAPRTRGRQQPKGVNDQLLATILAQAGEAILATDVRAHIVTWNAAAESLFGMPASEAIGQPLALLDSPDAQLSAIARQVLDQDAPLQTRIKGHRPDEEPLEIAASLAPIHDAEGHLLGLSMVARDDTANQRAEDALRDANRQKDEFLAIMSHELRTPLTSILGYTDMLIRGLGGPLSERSGKYVGNVRAAGDRLLELVNGLLDYTRLEAGAERLELGPVELRELVQRVVERCRGAAESKQIELQLSTAEAVGQVRADEDKLQHVLRNYVSNAIKFTPDGGRVTVELGRDPAHDDRARVTVSDSGVGMRNEQLARVWERFYQGDASLTRPYGGMGLGLSIARHLVHLHGGEVGADSKGPGRGSTFWFSLPLPGAKGQPRRARPAPQRAGTRS